MVDGNTLEPCNAEYVVRSGPVDNNTRWFQIADYFIDLLGEYPSIVQAMCEAMRADRNQRMLQESLKAKQCPSIANVLNGFA